MFVSKEIMLSREFVKTCISQKWGPETKVDLIRDTYILSNEYGMGGLEYAVLLDAHSEETLKKLIDLAYDNYKSSFNLLKSPWDQVKENAMLYPIVVSDSLDRFDSSLVVYEDKKGIKQAALLMQEYYYRFVSEQDIKNWRIDQAVFYHSAQENISKLFCN